MEGAHTVKKLLWSAAGALAGWIVWTKVQEEREERSIWAEVTDSFGETPDGHVPDRLADRAGR